MYRTRARSLATTASSFTCAGDSAEAIQENGTVHCEFQKRETQSADTAGGAIESVDGRT